jgi:hypothetical protein
VNEIVWQLPVSSKKTGPKAKYHAFKNTVSLCKNYTQDTDFFENSIEESELLSNIGLACKKCLKKAKIY